MNKTVKGTSLVAGGILIGAIGVTAFRFLTKMRNNKIDLSKDGFRGSASVSPFDMNGGSNLDDFFGFDESSDSFSSPDSFDMNGGSNMDDLHGDSYAEGEEPFSEEVKVDLEDDFEELYKGDY